MHSDEFDEEARAASVTEPVVEQARGVLVGAGCATPEFALEELRSAARAHEVDLDELAGAVVEVASGRTPDNPLLRKVVWQEWGDLLPNC